MCLFPWSASICEDGGRPKPNPEGETKLPCGKCHECIKLRATEWSIRCQHEISQHAHNCFLTLTYDPEHLESPFIVKTPFQKFIHDLRRHAKKKFKYIVSHEYGTEEFRPHHHCIIFGWEPGNQKLFSKNKGNPLYTSDDISRLWKQGFHSIGQANEKTAYYIASYALKKNTCEIPMADGELITVSDSMDSSKTPAIGVEHFAKNMETIVNMEQVFPRYYKKLLEGGFPKSYLKTLPPWEIEDLEKRSAKTLEKLENRKKIANQSVQSRLDRLKIDQNKKTKTSKKFRGQQKDDEFRFKKELLKDELHLINQGAKNGIIQRS